jgi:hypothetical protein
MVLGSSIMREDLLVGRPSGATGDCVAGLGEPPSSGERRYVMLFGQPCYQNRLAPGAVGDGPGLVEERVPLPRPGLLGVHG